jgi:glucan endo-1,3-alpha-glucosidase
MFEAAVRLHSGFKLMFSADMCCGNDIADVEDMMRRFAGNVRYAPVYFKYRDAYVLTTFAGDKLGVAAWQQIRADLATGTNPSKQAEPTVLSAVTGPPSNAPMRIFLVPAFFWGGELPSRSSIEQSFDEWRTALDGFFYWGIAGVPGSGGALDQLPSSHSYAAVLHDAGKLYMAPICLQFWGANANRYYEYGGAAGMRTLWMDAIHVTHPDWVEIITWNDFIEGTYVSPIDDPNKYPGANFLDSTGVPIGTRGYFHSHKGVAALLSFFIQWYKTGVEPAIRHDAIYYFYRTQLKGADASSPPPAHKFGPVADLLYITANLTAPAELRVTTGGQIKILFLQAGSTDVQTPILAGDPPLFELIRNGQTIGSDAASDPIQREFEHNDYYYSTGTVAAP